VFLKFIVPLLLLAAVGYPEFIFNLSQAVSYRGDIRSCCPLTQFYMRRTTFARSLKLKLSKTLSEHLEIAPAINPAVEISYKKWHFRIWVQVCSKYRPPTATACYMLTFDTVHDVSEKEDTMYGRCGGLLIAKINKLPQALRQISDPSYELSYLLLSLHSSFTPNWKHCSSANPILILHVPICSSSPYQRRRWVLEGHLRAEEALEGPTVFLSGRERIGHHPVQDQETQTWRTLILWKT